MGFAILRKAIQLVFANLGDAFRISGLLYFLQLVVALSVGLALGLAGQISAAPVFEIVTAILFLVVIQWIAVAWHRYIILEERPTGWLPPFRADRILRYFGRALLVGLVGLPIILAISVGVPFLLQVAGLGPTIAAGIVLACCFFAVTYRLALILPAVAVGKPLTLRGAWAATRGHTGTIIATALLALIAYLLLVLPGVLLQQINNPILANLWQAVVVGWVRLMVGVSILTTLYGHFVEGRAIE